MSLIVYEAANEKLSISVTTVNDTATISLKGVFSVYARRNFNSTYVFVLNKAEIKNIVVNLAAVKFMDSSALGMLLELREYAGAVNQLVCLSNPIENVKQMLNIACFYKLFSIVDDVSLAKQKVPVAHCAGQCIFFEPALA